MPVTKHQPPATASSVVALRSPSPDEGDRLLSDMFSLGLMTGGVSSGTGFSPLGLCVLSRSEDIVSSVLEKHARRVSFPSAVPGEKFEGGWPATDRKGVRHVVFGSPGAWALETGGAGRSFFGSRSVFRIPKVGARWGGGSMERRGVFVVSAHGSEKDALSFCRTVSLGISGAVAAAGGRPFVSDDSPPVVAVLGNGSDRHALAADGSRFFDENGLAFPGSRSSSGASCREEPSFAVARWNIVERGGLFLAEGFVDCQSLAESLLRPFGPSGPWLAPSVSPFDTVVDRSVKNPEKLASMLAKAGLSPVVDDIGGFSSPVSWPVPGICVVSEKNGLFEVSSFVPVPVSRTAKSMTAAAAMAAEALSAASAFLAAERTETIASAPAARRPPVERELKKELQNGKKSGDDPIQHDWIRPVAKRTVKLGSS